MGKCNLCNKTSLFISEYLGVCLNCIRQNFNKAKIYIQMAHEKSRKDFDLPISPHRAKDGISCNLCVNECKIPEREFGFCGLRRNLKGKIKGVSSKKGSLFFYFDGLPTNCVASWVCAGCSDTGFPEFSYTKGPEYGYKNLAVFYNGCSFNCLFCQNEDHKRVLKYTTVENFISPEELVEVIDDKTSCICYFGGDPSCQLPHSILTSKIALRKRKNNILRVCWETNGSMNSDLLEEILILALKSGGCVKFDLKAWTEEVHIALCGVSNKRTLENFFKASLYFKKRESPPLLIASTLLIPGYIDEYEVEKIANFIAECDPNIPYSLLAFHPLLYMKDLPTTPYKLAVRCKEIAQKAGLKNVHIGNVHLLSSIEYDL